MLMILSVVPAHGRADARQQARTAAIHPGPARCRWCQALQVHVFMVTNSYNSYAQLHYLTVQYTAYSIHHTVVIQYTSCTTVHNTHYHHHHVPMRLATEKAFRTMNPPANHGLSRPQHALREFKAPQACFES